MIALRPLRPEDVPAIKAWPPYPPGFAMLDYALRDGGWIDDYGKDPATEILVAEDETGIAGFSLLMPVSARVAEFRIALHPGRIGRGVGREIAILALQHAFSDPERETIRLIVRKNNPRAERLYESLHFRHTGECTEPVHGEPVAFRRMEIDRAAFGEVKRS